MTHPSPRQFLLTPPQDLEAARAFGLPLALMAWQLDGQGRLTQAPLPPQAQGGLMLVGANQPIQEGADPRRAAQEILAQCRSRACAEDANRRWKTRMNVLDDARQARIAAAYFGGKMPWKEGKNG